jgi:hypothetical protein
MTIPRGPGADKEIVRMSVIAMLRSHPDQLSHTDVLSRCIDACAASQEACIACSDACLGERDLSRLVTCIRLNLDCATVCNATGAIIARSNKAGHRQLVEAQLTTCIAFCRACASECERHATMHKHCEFCAKTCARCAEACNDLLSSMRMPA